MQTRSELEGKLNATRLSQNIKMTMLENYIPILVFIAVGVMFGVLPILFGKIFSMLLKVDKPDPEKLSPFECGFDEFEDARMKLPFYSPGLSCCRKSLSACSDSSR